MRGIKAYNGRYIAYRAWYNGHLIWDYGTDTMGDLVAALNAVAKPETATPDPILLHGDATVTGAGLAAVWELEPVLAHADATVAGNVAPHAAEAKNAAGQMESRLQVLGAAATFGQVFTSGVAESDSTAPAMPRAAEAENAAGTSESVMASVLLPKPDAVLSILAAAEGNLHGAAAPGNQDVERVLMRSAASLTGATGASTLEVHTVTFMVDGEIKHQEKVIHGYACPDPVETGAIDSWEAEVTETTLVALLETEDLPGFVQHPDFGMYFTAFSKSFSLVVGESYTVSWDGQEYEVIAQDASALNGGAEMNAIGNGAAFGMSGNNEPFIIATTADAMMFFVVDPSDTSDTHNVGVFQKEESVVEVGDPLSCVTQDIVVYPTFTESIRYYMVRFYDGDALVDVVLAPYGGTAVTSYMKEGYNKVTWVPSNENITGNTDCYGEFGNITFAASTWSEIAEIAEAGETEQYFKVGDTKTLEFTYGGTTLNVPVVLAGIKHDTLADGSGKANLSIVCNQAIITIAPMSSAPANNEYRWVGSPLRTRAISFESGLPSDLKPLIKSVYKVSKSGRSVLGNWTTGALVTTTDKIWYLSDTEVGFGGEEGAQYPIFTDDASRKRLCLNKTYATKYYLRSGNTQYAACASAVTATGEQSYLTHKQLTAGEGYGLVFGFCI